MGRAILLMMYMEKGKWYNSWGWVNSNRICSEEEKDKLILTAHYFDFSLTFLCVHITFIPLVLTTFIHIYKDFVMIIQILNNSLYFNKI